MAIRKDGVMAKCPECGSTNIVVVKITTDGEVRECQDCGEHWMCIRN